VNKEYIRGFEDALELALIKIKNLKTIEECKKEIKYLLSLVKEKKYEYLEYELKVLH